MRSFFLTYSNIVIAAATAANLVFHVLLILSYKKTKKLMPLCMGMIAFGLFYDGLIISFGNTLSGSEGLLSVLSRLRYISHGLFVPLIFPICAYTLTKNRKRIVTVWIITAVMIALGVASGFAAELELVNAAGVRRHAIADTTPAWADAVTYLLSFGSVIPLIVSGIIVWRKQKTPALFLSGFLMFAFSALPPATGNFDLIFSISIIGEVLMIVFMYFYQRNAV